MKGSVSAEAVHVRLKLSNTSFPTRAALPRPFSHGYYAGADGTGAIQDYTRVNPAVAWTAGAMVSTLDDLFTCFGYWIGHDGAIFGFSTAMFYERGSGARIVAAANLSSNFSTPTLEVFAVIAQRLYPASLGPD